MNNPGGLAQEKEDPWVCPNDRELSLRAKLQSGWSFHTNRQLTSKKVSVKKEEQEIIANIIKKSEEVALREEYRIGRLVDRLENIKNNAKGNGVTSCLLCNEKFGKITATPMKCNICEKAACSKCGVDTISSGSVPIWLCKLCNEQREFWKKSGAWFLRRMPQHKLPSGRERYLTSGSFVVPTPELTRKSISRQSERSELYSDSDQESTPSASSEELLDDDHRHVLKRRPTVEPSLTTVEPPDEPDAPPRSRQSSLIRAEEFGSLSRSRTPSPSFSDHRKGSPHSLREDSDDDSQHSRGSRFLRHSPLLVRKNKRHSMDSNPSTTSDQLLPVSRSNDDEHNPQILTSGFNHEQVEDFFQTYGSDYKLSGPLGVIEFTLNYLKDVKRLDVHIHNAKGLRAMDNSGTSDPYVKIHLLPGASKSNKTRTHTFHKTLDPIFNETLTYHGITEEDMKNKTLRLQVLDEDRLRRNDFIGQTSVPLKQVLVINNMKMQKILEPKSETSDDSPGRIHISLCYVSKEQKLVVGIIRCANLVAMDTNGYSDPYVKCYLLPDPSKKTKRRTKVKKKNLNPEFNETFSYKILHNELAKRTLEITVWDYDVGKSNDFIGGVHMGIRSRGSLLKQWFETLKDQNKEFKYWHTLTRDIILHEAE